MERDKICYIRGLEFKTWRMVDKSRDCLYVHKSVSCVYFHELRQILLQFVEITTWNIMNRDG